MRQANSDTWIGIIFIFFCGFALWQIKQLPAGVGYENTIGPEFFPTVMTGAIAVFSGALIVRSLWGHGVTGASSPALAAGATLARMGLFIALIAFYVFIYEILGFVLASAIVLPTGMFLLGERRILHAIILPCILVGLAWLAFTKIMMVPLPEGPWNFW